MKKIILVALALLMMLALVACGGESACAHQYSESIETPALALRDGVKRITCTICGDSYTEAIPMTKTFKILAVGNSFSDDAMEYLWNICRDGGVENIILGNLYVGGCTLDKHYNYLQKKSAAYIYRKNTSGEWISTENTDLITAFRDEKWDIITVQQASGSSGITDTYSNLNDLVDELKMRNPKAEIYWHMTWAYQADSDHAEFPKYESDQMTMYKAIIAALNEKVLTNEKIKGVIPSGTAIQNLRLSEVGDTVTRDGYHLSYDYGRYTASLTWFAYLTGGDVDAITWLPETAQSIKLDIVKKCVKDAISEPYKITK